MKAVFLLVCIALFLASAKVLPMNSKQARTVAPEAPSLQIEFQGTCEEFRSRVLPSVTISAYTNCLPLRLVGPGFPVNAEIDDLHAHYFCTDKSKGRSVHHFVEIFSVTDDVQVPDFIVALQPTAPFRVLTKGTTLSRRPNCQVTEDYCNGTNPIVSGCSTNNVVCKGDWALNNDRIYITSNQKVTNDCKDNQVCCNYITPSLFGGICARTANDELLAFQEREGYRPEHKPEHRPQEEHRPERPQEHRPQESGYGRPQEEEHRPEHRPGQGRPGHGRPGHGRPQEEHRPKPGPHRDEEEEDKKRTEQKPAAPKQEEKKEDEEEED